MSRSGHRALPTLLVAVALLSAACTIGPAETTTTSVPPETTTTTTTTLQTTTTTTTVSEPDLRFDSNSVLWDRQVVAPSGPALYGGRYQDIAALETGFITVGQEWAGVIERPAAWWTPDGRFWQPVELPGGLEGRLNAVDFDGEVVIMVGWDSASGTGLILRSSAGGQLVEVPLDAAVDFSEVVATKYGFVAYGLEDPTVEFRTPVNYLSVDGLTWEPGPHRVVRDVVAAVKGPGELILEVPEVGFDMTVWIVDPATLFNPDPETGEETQWMVDLGRTLGSFSPNPMTAVATETGFVIGGGEARSNDPMLWHVPLPTANDLAVTAELIEFVAPQESWVWGPNVSIRHLARAEDRWFAVVTAQGKHAEGWSSADLRSWDYEEVIGVDSTADRYASATSLTGPGTYPEEVRTPHGHRRQLSLRLVVAAGRPDQVVGGRLAGVPAAGTPVVHRVGRWCALRTGGRARPTMVPRRSRCRSIPRLWLRRRSMGRVRRHRMGPRVEDPISPGHGISHRLLWHKRADEPPVQV